MILTRNTFIYFRFSGSGLKRGRENNTFNRVRVLRTVRHTPTQKFGEYPPVPGVKDHTEKGQSTLLKNNS